MKVQCQFSKLLCPWSADLHLDQRDIRVKFSPVQRINNKRFKSCLMVIIAMPYLGIVYKKFLGSLTPCNILIHPLFSAHEGHTQMEYPFMYAHRTVQCIVLYNAGVYRNREGVYICMLGLWNIVQVRMLPESCNTFAQNIFHITSTLIYFHQINSH